VILAIRNSSVGWDASILTLQPAKVNTFPQKE